MSRRPWYKRYPGDFIAGTAMLTDAEKGVYSTIIDLLYDKGGPIEDSPSDLARICGCASVKRFQSIKERLVKLGKLAVVGDHITNARFEREGARIDSGIQDRLSTPPPEKPPDLLNINGLDDPISQKPEARGQKSERRARARHSLPKDFALSPSDLSYATDLGFDNRKISFMFGAFRDHHLSRGNTMADWHAAWRTWCRNEVKFAKPSGGSQGRGMNAFAAMVAEDMRSEEEF